MVEQSFYNMPLRVKNLKHHTLQSWDVDNQKRYLQKDSVQSLWKSLPIRQTCVAKFQGTDSCIHMTHLKKVPNPDWTCISSGHMKVKISQNWSRQLWMTLLSHDIPTRPVRSVNVWGQAFDNDKTCPITSDVYDLDNTWTLEKSTLEFSLLPLLVTQCDLNRFPIYALSLQCEAIFPGKAFPITKGQKVAEIRKPDSWSAILSEKDCDQKGKI